MKPDELKYYDQLLSRLLDGELSELEREQLMRHLQEDDEMQHELALHLELSERMSRESTSRSEKSFLDTAETHLLAKETEDVFVRSVMARIEEEQLATSKHSHFFLKEVVFYTAVAAVIAMAFTLFWTRPAEAFEDAVSLASVSYSEGLDKEAAAALLPDSELIGQELEMKSGIVRLELSNGASVTVEAPAEFLIESPFRFHLRNGRISAFCPPSAHGFTVLTSKVDVIDLGTSFGVSADDNGDSRVVVFDGEVEVEEKSSEEAPRRLNTGDALEITQERTERVQFDGRPYRNIWPVNSGIMHTSGSVVPPQLAGVDQLAYYENDEHMIIFPEKRGVKLGENLSATKLIPGELLEFPTNETVDFEPKENKRYTSYLLHFNPVGSDSFERIKGWVVFNRPVVAVLAKGTELLATDTLFSKHVGDLPENWGNGRGLEGHGETAPGDKIFLNKSRKRVRFDIYAGSYIDEIRIIVEEKSRKKSD